MRKATVVIGVGALALIGIGVLVHSNWPTERAAARVPGRANRVIPVEVAKAVRKQVPIRVDALGTVTPIASVALKTRVDTTIVGVHFQDGAHVNKGDLLFTLDCRAIDAQIAQTQGAIARDQAQYEGAMRDFRRYTDLVAKGATPIVNRDNAKTQADVFTAATKADQGLLQNLQVQRSYCTITAPIAGHISMANVKVGNFVRQADTSPMATIIQISPVYVSFTVPQKELPEIRQALAAKSAGVDAIVPGTKQRAEGQVSMIENTVDAATGMATLRAVMPNKDELLWPGTLVTTEMTLRTEQAVVVPSTAVQVSQTGSFVFVVDKNAAKIQHVSVARQVGSESVIASGLKGGETVVVEGQLLLSNGTRVSVRPPRPASKPATKPAGS